MYWTAVSLVCFFMQASDIYLAVEVPALHHPVAPSWHHFFFSAMSLISACMSTLQSSHACSLYEVKDSCQYHKSNTVPISTSGLQAYLFVGRALVSRPPQLPPCGLSTQFKLITYWPAERLCYDSLWLSEHLNCFQPCVMSQRRTVDLEEKCVSN